MNIQTSKGLVRCRWQYNACPKHITVHNGEQISVEQDCTSCILSDENKEEIYKVTISRYHKDLPNKPLARKTTFKLAIVSFSKSDKALLWKAFLEHVKIK